MILGQRARHAYPSWSEPFAREQLVSSAHNRCTIGGTRRKTAVAQQAGLSRFEKHFHG
jgi:hypothetical protein